MSISSRRAAAIALAGLLAIVGRSTAADDAIFAIQELASQGRIVTAHFADFDGDQRSDLMIVSLEGIPPEESRTIRVYLQQDDSTFPKTPSHSVALPAWSSVYDVADLKEAPGAELILLRPDGVTILSIASASARQWDLPVDGPSTVGAADDERGFDHFRLVYRDFGKEPWILIPQIGVISALTADGALQAQIEVGRRANYFVVPQSAPFTMESDIQLFLDAPKLAIGDVDGDGRSDMVVTTRHEIRVFLQTDHAAFPRQANQKLPLRFLSTRDHVRGSGGVISTMRDIDGDGRLDLMVTHIEGSFSDAITRTSIFYNLDGSWNLAEPDQSFVSDGALGSDLLLDLDQDDVLELVRIRQRFSMLEMIEILLTQEIDSQVFIHRLKADGNFDTRPWAKKKISTGISFDTFRPEGFLSPTGLDLNADGLMDFVTSIDGKGIEVFLGGEKKPYSRRTASQKFPSAGVIHFADFDGDSLLDFVLINPQEFDSLVRIGRNLGVLPDSNKAISQPD